MQLFAVQCTLNMVEKKNAAKIYKSLLKSKRASIQFQDPPKEQMKVRFLFFWKKAGNQDENKDIRNEANGDTSKDKRLAVHFAKGGMAFQEMKGGTERKSRCMSVTLCDSRVAAESQQRLH